MRRYCCMPLSLLLGPWYRARPGAALRGIEDFGGIGDFPHGIDEPARGVAHGEVQVRARGPSRAAHEPHVLPPAHSLAGLYEGAAQVAVDGRLAVLLADFHCDARAAARARLDAGSVFQAFDGPAEVGAEINSRMIMVHVRLPVRVHAPAAGRAEGRGDEGTQGKPADVGFFLCGFVLFPVLRRPRGSLLLCAGCTGRLCVSPGFVRLPGIRGVSRSRFFPVWGAVSGAVFLRFPGVRRQLLLFRGSGRLPVLPGALSWRLSLSLRRGRSPGLRRRRLPFRGSAQGEEKKEGQYGPGEEACCSQSVVPHKMNILCISGQVRLRRVCVRVAAGSGCPGSGATLCI